jgi:excisionase family DNA binding protein
VDRPIPPESTLPGFPATLPPILSTAQAAMLLDCDPQQVRLLAANHRLPGHKFGRSWVFETTLFMAYVRRLCAANVLGSAEPAPGSDVTQKSLLSRLSPTPARPETPILRNAVSRQGPGRPRAPVPAVPATRAPQVPN